MCIKFVILARYRGKSRDEAVQRAKEAEVKAKVATAKCVELAKTHNETSKWARQLKIDKEKEHYKSLGDKRAMEYLLKEEYDLKDVKKALELITPATEGDPFITPHNHELVEATVATFAEFLNMRIRKRKREEECYSIAKTSLYGWGTTSAFLDEGTFKDDDKSTEFWENPELSVEKKQEKLQKAERDVKWQLAAKKQFNNSIFPRGRGGVFRPPSGGKYFKFRGAGSGFKGGNSGFKGGNSGGYSGSYSDGGSGGGRGSYADSGGRGGGFVPMAERQCHSCGALGHISPMCPQKFQQPTKSKQK